MEEQNEKHEFMKYEKAIINFVFSFSWDVVNYSFDNIEEKLSNIDESNWHKMPLYKRQLWWVNQATQASYHPTIVSENLRVMCKGELLEEGIKIVAPTNKINDEKQNKVVYKEIIASLRYDIRIYENGTGTCTFSIFSDCKSCEINFEKILLIQHLATSISHLNLNEINDEELLNQKHLTHSFIKVSQKLKHKFNFKSERVYLAQLFSALLNSFDEIKEFVWDEKKVIFNNPKTADTAEKQDWQNPYVISIIQTSKEDMKRIFKSQDRLTTKEIGAIAVRLTQDNSEDAEVYFESLRREYIYKSLGFYVNPQEKNLPFKVRLRNYSHSNSLFYTYGRRAAIAITSDFESHPSYFAIPTFVNILELLRSRWHLGTIANLKLDETFEKVAHRKDINNLIDEIYKCRILYGLFLQNPTPYLFDSGAVTEISDSAENVFWLSRISNELEKKLSAIDKIVEVKFTKESMGKYL